MSKFNEDELHAPDWMNKDFFNDVLKKCEITDSVVVTDVKISPATLRGDHFASIMFRAVVTYDSNQTKGISKSLIVKTMPEHEGDKKDMIGKTHVFETEISMYQHAIPKLEAELKRAGDNTVLGARALYYSLEPRSVIVFEDICPMGYEVMRDREANIGEAKAAFLKLAKMHAVSYKLAAEGDTSITNYKEGFCMLPDFENMPFIATGFENLIELIETIDELKCHVPKLRLIQKDILQRCKNSANSFWENPSVGINVLCHGDFHRKNMMFKHNSKGELQDVLLLDFQISSFGPAIFDVMHGTYMLMDAESRKNNYEEIIHFYSSNFIETLKKLKFQGDIPKISDFFVEIFRHRHFDLFLLSTLLPIWYAMAEAEVDPEKLVTDNEERKKYYYHSGYVAEVKRILPMMLYKGFLE